MTDTIKQLQEVREALQWVAGFCDGYVIAPKEGDKLVVERCDNAIATLDAVIAGMHHAQPNVDDLVRKIYAARYGKMLSHFVTSSGVVLIDEEETIALIRKWANKEA